jgi:hypothetical protein
VNASEVVHEEAVSLPRLLAHRREGDELREPLELNARGELAAEVSFEILEKVPDQMFERRGIGPVGRARGVRRQRREAA